MTDPSEISVPPPAAPQPGPMAARDTTLPDGEWRAARALTGLAILLLVVILAAAVVAAFDSEIESLGARLALQVTLAAALIGVALAVAAPGDEAFVRLSALGLRRPVRPALGASLMAYFAYIGCALVIAGLLQPEQEDVTRELGVDEGTFGAIAAGLLIVVAAPISEEVFFRGFMFAGLRRSTGFWIGAAISSAVWGLFHYTGPDSWAVCLQLALFGLALCWLYERTGSIWPPIAVHTFNNALAFTILTS